MNWLDDWRRRLGKGSSRKNTASSSRPPTPAPEREPEPEPEPEPLPEPQRAIDRLPAELWLAILAHASALPWALDPHALDSSLLAQWDTAHFPAALMVPFYTASQRTKLCVALASKRLRALALPELYRYVWLHKRAQARRLAETLDACPAFGAWIRRLDIDCQAARPGAMQASALDVRRILQPCTGLAVLLDRAGTYVNVGDHTAHWDVMLRPHAPGLRRVGVTHYGERARIGATIEVLGLMAAALEVLELDVSLLELWHAADEDEAAPRLPLVKTLVLTMTAHEACAPLLALMAHWQLPALRHLALLGTFAPSDELRDFVVAHGGGLEHLELGSADLPPHQLSSQPAPRPPWVMTSELLPNLRTLVVSANRNYRIPHPMLPAHDGVTLLGVRELERKVREMHSQGVLGQLGDCMPSAGRFPALQEVRSLSYGESPTTRMVRDAEAPVLQLFWRRLIQLAANAVPPVRVCDPWGRPIVLPTGEVDRAWGAPPRLTLLD